MKTLHPTGNLDIAVTCGVVVPHDLMAPVYRKGDVALCAPCEWITAGRDYIITTTRRGAPLPVVGEKGLMRIACVERITAREIFAREYNPPKVRRFSGAKWRGLYRITGKYNGPYSKVA